LSLLEILYSNEIGNNIIKNNVPSIILETKKFKISANLNHAMAMYFATGFTKIPESPTDRARYKNTKFPVSIYITRNAVVKTSPVSSIFVLSINSN
jgi:hypothetical protein